MSDIPEKLDDLLPLSPDHNSERLATLKRLFPDLFTNEGRLNEDELKKVVDPALVSETERYDFRWYGKTKSKRDAFTPSRAALVYDKDRSVNPEQADGNMIIEGETEDDRTRIEVRLEGDTVWLTQKQMAELFQKDVRTVNEHLKNVFEEGELRPESVLRKFRITATDGKSYETQHYNLDAILSVGYRVKSQRGTQFRIWATQRLREYIVKGFVLDDERLKSPPGPGVPDHFDELLERIRDIRASERRMYLRVREILALAADYDPSDTETQVFFQTVQNKLHFAVTGHTAPELIVLRSRAGLRDVSVFACAYLS